MKCGTMSVHGEPTLQYTRAVQASPCAFADAPFEHEARMMFELDAVANIGIVQLPPELRYFSQLTIHEPLPSEQLRHRTSGGQCLAKY